MSSASSHHTDDPPSTRDSVVKSRKGKARNPCLLCKDMHFTYLCPHMDEASNLLEDIIVSRQWIPIGYCKLSHDITLVDNVVNLNPSLVHPALPLKSKVKVVDPVLTSIDPTLPLKSEVEVVNPSPSLVDPTLPLESEVKVVESTSSPPDPTLSLESVETEVFPSTQSLSCPSLLIESQNHPAEVFVVSSDCSTQEEILSLSIESSPSTESIYFD